MQRPASREPARLGQRRRDLVLWRGDVNIHVDKVREADGGPLVVAVHAVDGFGELGRRRLVDAAGVDPYPVVALGLGEAAGCHDFWMPALPQPGRGALPPWLGEERLQRRLLVAPRVR